MLSANSMSYMHEYLLPDRATPDGVTAAVVRQSRAFRLPYVLDMTLARERHFVDIITLQTLDALRSKGTHGKTR